nr:protein AE7-like 1 [Cryptomonas paramecium]
MLRKYQIKYWFPLCYHLFILFNDVKDPEFLEYISNLNIVSIENIWFEEYVSDQFLDSCVTLVPTYFLCNMISSIGLSLKNILCKKKKIFLKYVFPENWSFRYCTNITFDFHSEGLYITKQLNDKERTCAALENSSVRNIIKLSY